MLPGLHRARSITCFVREATVCGGVLFYQRRAGRNALHVRLTSSVSDQLGQCPSEKESWFRLETPACQALRQTVALQTRQKPRKQTWEWMRRNAVSKVQVQLEFFCMTALRVYRCTCNITPCIVHSGLNSQGSLGLFRQLLRLQPAKSAKDRNEKVNLIRQKTERSVWRLLWFPLLENCLSLPGRFFF